MNLMRHAPLQPQTPPFCATSIYAQTSANVQNHIAILRTELPTTSLFHLHKIRRTAPESFGMIHLFGLRGRNDELPWRSCSRKV